MSLFWDTVMQSPGIVQYGQRLVPNVIDEVATNDPERVCFSFPQSENPQDGFQDLSFRVFANAINKTAYFIQREIGRSSMFETVMYIGHSDVRYFIVLVALMKTGHKILLSSHGNSMAGHLNLITRTDCSIMLHTADFPVESILERSRMESLVMPELDYLLDPSLPCEHYVYDKSFEEARDHPCIVLHTSGATGLPEPIVWSHWALITCDSHHLLRPLDDRMDVWGRLLDSCNQTFLGQPIFYGVGITSGITQACFNDAVVVLTPSILINADVFEAVLDHAAIDAANCAPATLEEIATRPDILSKLGRLKYITYIGGTLSKKAGEAISRHVRLGYVMASTETSSVIQYATDAEDWQYACFDPAYCGIEMRAVGELYELFFVKDPKLAQFQGVFKIAPRLEEFSMSELYSKHPTKPHHWKFEGRLDSTIVLKTGWRFNPVIHEHFIMSHEAVQNCVLIGTGREMAVAIVELHLDFYTDKEHCKRGLREALQSRIDRANTYADSSSQLREDCIIFATKEKPFATADRGVVQRKATTALYSAEIDELYASMG